MSALYPNSDPRCGTVKGFRSLSPHSPVFVSCWLAAAALVCLTPRAVFAQTVSYPKIPEGITSFGAAILNGALYTYGGHKGQAHHYSVQGQSNLLRRLDLRQPGQWEVVGKGPRLQGLAMVAYGGKLYRVGGFAAHNKEGQDHDLRSVADFARWDPRTNEWEQLPALPRPRSSHDAVVIGDKLYVVGGWSLQGGNKTKWLDAAHVINLAKTPYMWRELPKAPFQRRALSAGTLEGKLYAIGGMQREGGPTTRVDIFDPLSQTWSQGPSLDGQGMEGFGSSAFVLGDTLYVSTYSGRLQSLSAGDEAWQVEKKLADDRFFHRMIPLDTMHLIIVGGASMEAGKRLKVEKVRIE